MYRNKRISLVMPCLNEEKGLPQIARDLPAIVDQVIVVDNNSSDHTAAVARTLQSGWYILGQEGRAFEAEVAAWFDAKSLDDEKAVARRLNKAALDHVVYAPLGFFQPRVAEARQLHPALVQRERLLERHVAFLELLHGRFELGDGGFEVFD